MKIVYLGTPIFAVTVLEVLHQSSHEVVAVVTTPDRRGGRGRTELIESDVKKSAHKLMIPILQPPKLKDPNFISKLRSLHADVFVVVAFRMLPEVVWNMPPQGTINLHGSLLPKFRGAAPIHRAVMSGAAQTGVTTFRLQHAIDTGNILLQESIPIPPNATTGEVHDALMLTGAALMLKTIDGLENGLITPRSQDASLVSHAPKIFTEDCALDPQLSAQEAHNFVRGLDPFPGAWISIDEKMTKIYGSKIHNNLKLNVGEIKELGDRLYIQCADGGISIADIKPAGKRKMTVQSFLNGKQHLPKKIG